MNNNPLLESLLPGKLAQGHADQSVELIKPGATLHHEVLRYGRYARAENSQAHTQFHLPKKAGYIERDFIRFFLATMMVLGVASVFIIPHFAEIRRKYLDEKNSQGDLDPPPPVQEEDKTEGLAFTERADLIPAASFCLYMALRGYLSDYEKDSALYRQLSEVTRIQNTATTLPLATLYDKMQQQIDFLVEECIGTWSGEKSAALLIADLQENIIDKRADESEPETGVEESKSDSSSNSSQSPEDRILNAIAAQQQYATNHPSAHANNIPLVIGGNNQRQIADLENQLQTANQQVNELQHQLGGLHTLSEATLSGGAFMVKLSTHIREKFSHYSSPLRARHRANYLCTLLADTYLSEAKQAGQLFSLLYVYFSYQTNASDSTKEQSKDSRTFAFLSTPHQVQIVKALCANWVQDQPDVHQSAVLIATQLFWHDAVSCKQRILFLKQLCENDIAEGNNNADEALSFLCKNHENDIIALLQEANNCTFISKETGQWLAKISSNLIAWSFLRLYRSADPLLYKRETITPALLSLLDSSSTLANYDSHEDNAYLESEQMLTVLKGYADQYSTGIEDIPALNSLNQDMGTESKTVILTPACTLSNNNNCVHSLHYILQHKPLFNAGETDNRSDAPTRYIINYLNLTNGRAPHHRFILVDEDVRTIVFWDPYGQNSNYKTIDNENIVECLHNYFNTDNSAENYTIIQPSVCAQTDSHRCGDWFAVAAQWGIYSDINAAINNDTEARFNQFITSKQDAVNQDSIRRAIIPHPTYFSAVEENEAPGKTGNDHYHRLGQTIFWSEIFSAPFRLMTLRYLLEHDSENTHYAYLFDHSKIENIHRITTILQLNSTHATSLFYLLSQHNPSLAAVLILYFKDADDRLIKALVDGSYRKGGVKALKEIVESLCSTPEMRTRRKKEADIEQGSRIVVHMIRTIQTNESNNHRAIADLVNQFRETLSPSLDLLLTLTRLADTSGNAVEYFKFADSVICVALTEKNWPVQNTSSKDRLTILFNPPSTWPENLWRNSSQVIAGHTNAVNATVQLVEKKSLLLEFTSLIIDRISVINTDKKTYITSFLCKIVTYIRTLALHAREPGHVESLLHFARKVIKTTSLLKNNSPLHNFMCNMLLQLYAQENTTTGPLPNYTDIMKSRVIDFLSSAATLLAHSVVFNAIHCPDNTNIVSTTFDHFLFACRFHTGQFAKDVSNLAGIMLLSKQVSNTVKQSIVETILSVNFICQLPDMADRLELCLQLIQHVTRINSSPPNTVELQYFIVSELQTFIQTSTVNNSSVADLQSQLHQSRPITVDTELFHEFSAEVINEAMIADCCDDGVRNAIIALGQSVWFPHQQKGIPDENYQSLLSAFISNKKCTYQTKAHAILSILSLADGNILSLKQLIVHTCRQASDAPTDFLSQEDKHHLTSECINLYREHSRIDFSSALNDLSTCNEGFDPTELPAIFTVIITRLTADNDWLPIPTTATTTNAAHSVSVLRRISDALHITTAEASPPVSGPQAPPHEIQGRYLLGNMHDLYAQSSPYLNQCLQADIINTGVEETKGGEESGSDIETPALNTDVVHALFSALGDKHVDLKLFLLNTICQSILEHQENNVDSLETLLQFLIDHRPSLEYNPCEYFTCLIKQLDDAPGLFTFFAQQLFSHLAEHPLILEQDNHLLQETFSIYKSLQDYQQKQRVGFALIKFIAFHKSMSAEQQTAKIFMALQKLQSLDGRGINSSDILNRNIGSLCADMILIGRTTKEEAINIIHQYSLACSQHDKANVQEMPLQNYLTIFSHLLDREDLNKETLKNCVINCFTELEEEPLAHLVDNINLATNQTLREEGWFPNFLTLLIAALASKENQEALLQTLQKFTTFGYISTVTEDTRPIKQQVVIDTLCLSHNKCLQSSQFDSALKAVNLLYDLIPVPLESQDYLDAANQLILSTLDANEAHIIYDLLLTLWQSCDDTSLFRYDIISTLELLGFSTGLQASHEMIPSEPANTSRMQRFSLFDRCSRPHEAPASELPLPKWSRLTKSVALLLIEHLGIELELSNNINVTWQGLTLSKLMNQLIMACGHLTYDEEVNYDLAAHGLILHKTFMPIIAALDVKNNQWLAQIIVPSSLSRDQFSMLVPPSLGELDPFIPIQAMAKLKSEVLINWDRIEAEIGEYDKVFVDFIEPPVHPLTSSANRSLISSSGGEEGGHRQPLLSTAAHNRHDSTNTSLFHSDSDDDNTEPASKCTIT
jgi:hypothetical protein